MSKIIPIDKKRELAADKKKEIIRKRKLISVQKILQCSRCSMKCEKCGTQIEHSDEQIAHRFPEQSVPYRFCDSCTDEYQDYIARLQGQGDPECYWHNDVWLEGWRLWIDYQAAVDRYLKSKEFVRLIKEIRGEVPGD